MLLRSAMLCCLTVRELCCFPAGLMPTSPAFPRCLVSGRRPFLLASCQRPGVIVLQSFRTANLLQSSELVRTVARLTGCFASPGAPFTFLDLACNSVAAGLYGAFVPPLVYSLFGSSKQLAVGPVAVTSMLLGNGLDRMFDFVNPNPNQPVDPVAQQEYNYAAVQVGSPNGRSVS